MCSCVCPSSPPPPGTRPYCGAEQQNPPLLTYLTPQPRSRIRTRKQLRDVPLGRTTPLKVPEFRVQAFFRHVPRESLGLGGDRRGATKGSPAKKSVRAWFCVLCYKRQNIGQTRIQDLLISRQKVCGSRCRHKLLQIQVRLQERRVVTGKSLDSPEKGNVDKMSEKCRKNCPEGPKTQFSDIFWTICLFGRCFCLVTLSNARPLQDERVEEGP